MDDVLSITIRLIYQDYCRALEMQYDPQRRHEFMSVLLFRAEEIGYDDYTRGNNQVPRLFNCQIGLRDAWLMGFAEAAIRDSVNQLRTSTQSCGQACEADVLGS
ncbi:hypothetical protein [Janthinobacterium lividum]|uniref:hypothetical protein n=1 Tax=Janthinobacterium lividum TaxID=29581 RepID=UPI001595353B|nr:hypothetical protein [Janthinobacterium lividum]QKY12043.1 hypothetical protein G8765_29590 [Janthinobacterium lividum]